VEFGDYSAAYLQQLSYQHKIQLQRTLILATQGEDGFTTFRWKNFFLVEEESKTNFPGNNFSLLWLPTFRWASTFRWVDSDQFSREQLFVALASNFSLGINFSLVTLGSSGSFLFVGGVQGERTNFSSVHGFFVLEEVSVGDTSLRGLDLEEKPCLFR